MLHDSLTAFYSGDIEMARQVPVFDDEVAALYNQISRELIAHVSQYP